ncbi:hypothetical protein BWQ96_03570 [Gracilariopsis chorda]|uniref:Uncharacterized protein n=1 Tax=Gracilariopsis chorda TaxID=448386 RepID=A0A2V3IWT8_9FLOR|nr:hypothetical protein BWQ96_03570 [Gracilariopsis chorda]|eukprot:PXF46581.1 hypothetical protein BWQ96_03570 [Gracilariopsis chorda]
MEKNRAESVSEDEVVVFQYENWKNRLNFRREQARQSKSGNEYTDAATEEIVASPNYGVMDLVMSAYEERHRAQRPISVNDHERLQALAQKLRAVSEHQDGWYNCEFWEDSVSRGRRKRILIMESALVIGSIIEDIVTEAAFSSNSKLPGMTNVSFSSQPSGSQTPSLDTTNDVEDLVEEVSDLPNFIYNLSLS